MTSLTQKNLNIKEIVIQKKLNSIKEKQTQIEQQRIEKTLDQGSMMIYLVMDHHQINYLHLAHSIHSATHPVHIIHQ